MERAGEFAAALALAQEALVAARDTQQPDAMASALICVARFRFRLGQDAPARALAEEAQRLAGPESSARAEALLMLGMCASETDALAETEAYYRQAADLARILGDHLLHLRALHNLASGVYLLRGQFDLALATDEEAYAVGVRHGLVDWLHFPLITIALNCQLTGRRQRACEALDRLDRTKAAAHNAATRAYHSLVRANLAMDEGDLARAADLLAHTRIIVREAGDPPLNIEMRLATSRLYRLLDDAAAAWDWADDALTLADRGGYGLRQGQCLCERGRAAWLGGDVTAAETDLRRALALLDPPSAAFDVANAALLLAALLQALQHEEAEGAWRDAAHRIASRGYAFLLERERTLAFPLVAAHLHSTDPATISLSAALLADLARVPPPPLTIAGLGCFEVSKQSRAVGDAAWRQRRAGELFRLLLISPGRSLLHDQVIEALWPDRTLDAALPLLHQATSALRRALEPDLPGKFPSRYLRVHDRRISLTLPPGSRIDFEAFEQLVRAGEHEAAVASYGGDLFPEDRYADWAAAERERLAELHGQALLAVARNRLAAGQPAAAVDACRGALAADPWREEAVLVGMEASLALGDRAGALRLYRELAHTLHEELGIAPQQELRQLFDRLRNL